MREILALALLAPITAIAAPVFLDCEITNEEGEKKVFSVSLDADNGKVTHTHDNGGAFKTEGFFATNTITYQKIDLTKSLRVTLKYEINRTDLSVIESFTLAARNKEILKIQPPTTTLSTGTCKISEVTERKI